MENLFAGAALAKGYSRSRPPVHARVIELLRVALPPPGRVRRALDIGCGAGLSTRPLENIAEFRLGVEPAVSMLGFAGTVAPGAVFAAGRSEQLPVRTGSIDLVTAAGSLNYSDPARFFPEVARVLAPDGILAIYDFSPGRRMPGTRALEEWFAAFMRRYPRPPDNALSITAGSLARMASGFTMLRYDPFEIGLVLEPAFYLEYMMTETNVGYALATGVPEEEIRRWSARALDGIFAGVPREILFDGYLACLTPAHGSPGR